MNGACAKCGYNPEVTVLASWVLTIERDPPSLNARLFNAGARRYAYHRERDAWIWEFRIARAALKIPPARTQRRVTFTRYYSGRQQERDRDNLIGGMKAVLDAMVHERLLVDDKPEWAELHYAQQRVSSTTPHVRGLEVLIEELVVEDGDRHGK